VFFLYIDGDISVFIIEINFCCRYTENKFIFFLDYNQHYQQREQQQQQQQ